LGAAVTETRAAAIKNSARLTAAPGIAADPVTIMVGATGTVNATVTPTGVTLTYNTVDPTIALVTGTSGTTVTLTAGSTAGNTQLQGVLDGCSCGQGAVIVNSDICPTS
jgi:hypothetical protein